MYAPLGYRVLYDHLADPYERRNLFSAETYARRRRMLHVLMVAMAENHEDPALAALKRTASG
ncbi:MAG: hypothetical protein JRG82_00005 [Deltaproteobacteria bacterium]|nr:hypothetical protein [Deltaproteobacteria bacterium]